MEYLTISGDTEQRTSVDRLGAPDLLWGLHTHSRPAIWITDCRDDGVAPLPYHTEP
jgi:hypothetical protein